MVKVNCDFCGQNNTTIISIHNDPLNFANKFYYVMCKNCELIYLDPQPSKKELLKYYPITYAPYQRNIFDEKNPLIRYIRDRNVSKKRKWIEKNTNLKRGSILDVGCSTGIFLNEMKRSGWKTKGIEISEFASDYAKNTFKLDIKIGELEETDFDGQSFNVISFWDVLEHTYSPSKQLLISNKLLKNDGFLIINIPNWNSFDNKLLNKFWAGYDPPRHLFIFKDIVISNMLNKYGFEIITKKCLISSYYGFIIGVENLISSKNNLMAKKIHNILMIPGIRFLFEPFLIMMNKINKGTVIIYLAQKKRVLNGR